MRKKGRTRTTARYVAPRQMSVSAEVSYIRALAVQRDSRVVSIGPLILFSTQSGDAWVLDPADSLALRLAENGDPLPSRIIETPERYMIEWDMTFRIEGDAFISLDSAGREHAIVGYPIGEIGQATARAKVQ
jgi:hypothetical protein